MSPYGLQRQDHKRKWSVRYGSTLRKRALSRTLHHRARLAGKKMLHQTLFS